MRACVIVIAALLAGCGSAQSADEAAVRHTVQHWIDAVVDHDDAAACAELSTHLRKQIERHLLGEGVAGSCGTWAAKYVSPRHPASRRDAQITAIRIGKARASVQLKAPGVPDGGARLVKERGEWRIDNY
jgi:hypothetical protein